MKKLEAELLKELFPTNLDKVKAQYGPLLKVMAVNVLNPPERALAELEKYGQTYQVLSGRGSGITKDYEVKKLPLLVIIDKDGKVREAKQYLNYQDLHDKVASLVKDIVK